MKRKMHCPCGNSIMVEGNGVPFVTLNPLTECLDCGTKRREAEEARKLARRETLLAKFAE